jgi:HK97 family phage prohead protease
VSEKKIIKFYKTEIKSVDSDSMTVEAVVSTKSVDRDGDIVTPQAFEKRIKTYKAHPVLLSSHNYGDLLKQIGEAVKVKVTDSGLEATFKYYAGMGNAEADWAWVLAQKGIASFSIGFIGHEFDYIRQKDGEAEMITGRKFTDVELLEISQVVVPSNRQALQMSVDSNELCELALKSFDELSKGFTVKTIVKAQDEKEESKPEATPAPSADQKPNDAGEVKPDVQPEAPAGTVVTPSGDEAKHYSASLFGEGDKNIDPIPSLTKSELEDAIKQTASKMLTKEK